MNLINKKNMEENMNDMHGEETPRTDLTLFSEKMQELKSRIASVIVYQLWNARWRQCSLPFPSAFSSERFTGSPYRSLWGGSTG